MRGDNFRVESYWAERSLDFLECAASAHEAGDLEKALMFRQAVGALAQVFGDAIRARGDDLALAADASVCVHTPGGGTLYCTSAHEAVSTLWVFVGVRPDAEEWLYLNLPLLRCNLKRERARLLAAEPQPLAQRPAIDGEPAVSVTDDEYSLLLALCDVAPRRLKVADLESRADLSRRTCGRLAAKLAKKGLVEYDASKRVGAAITEAGRSLLSKSTIQRNSRA